MPLTFRHILFISAFLILPGAWFGFFGWMNNLLPLAAFIYLYHFGAAGNRLLLQGLAAGVAGCLLLQSLDTVLFAVAMLPCGYVVAHSASAGLSPANTGLRASAVLCLSLFFMSLLLAAGGVPAHVAFLESLNAGSEELLRQYRNSDAISQENLLALERTLHFMREYVPKLLPSMLAGFAIFTTWTTMLIGNRLLFILTGERPWSSFKYWQLHEKLIWLLVASACITLLPIESARIAGINLLLITVLAYCLQGMAILVYFLNKWNLPKIFRGILYVMILLQSFGTLILAGVGVADVWFDFRRLNAGDEEKA